MLLHDALEPEQIQLFKEMAEAYYARPRDKRRQFMVLYTQGGAHLQGNGLLRDGLLWDDFVTLSDSGVFQYEAMTNSKGFNCVISPLGRQFYSEITHDAAQQTEQIEEHVWRYFDAPEFQQSYPRTYAKWREASELVWNSESERDFSTIGLACREAMQEFATELIEKYGVEGANPDKALTRDRFSAVVKNRREAIGETKAGVLDALFNYWREVGKLIQRQVHSREGQGDDLVWDDGRSVVFQLGFVMFEAARTLAG